ncbi:MAG: hypothetical protein QOH29_777 [Actinomycetota bacterium]|jgi:hypothetical protein|nr:hypothetical protein [Actinomycetota bacterium]
MLKARPSWPSFRNSGNSSVRPPRPSRRRWCASCGNRSPRRRPSRRLRRPPRRQRVRPTSRVPSRLWSMRPRVRSRHFRRRRLRATARATCSAHLRRRLHAPTRGSRQRRRVRPRVPRPLPLRPARPPARYVPRPAHGQVPRFPARPPGRRAWVTTPSRHKHRPRLGLPWVPVRCQVRRGRPLARLVRLVRVAACRRAPAAQVPTGRRPA